MILSQSEMKIALGNFVQRQSPLTTFARSLRMELATPKGDDAPSKESTEGDSPFLKGIDLDSLPEEARTALLEKEKEFKAFKTNETKLSEELEKQKRFTSEHQARADRFHTKLKQHDLLDDNRQPNASKNEDALVQTLAAKFIAKGMDPKVAQTQAMVFATVMPEMAGIASNQVLGAVAPLGTAVGNMQVDSALAQANLPENDPNGYLGMKEIKEEVETQARFLATQGTHVDLATINNLRAMAVGNYIQKEGIEKMTNMRNNQQQQQPSNFGGGNNFGGGGYRNTNRQSSQKQGAPAAVDTDTQRAAEATLAVMLKGITKK